MLVASVVESLGSFLSAKRKQGCVIGLRKVYDDLNRPTSQTLNGATTDNLTYDSFGNIKTQDSNTYSYDASGNIGGDDRTLSYTTFDKPLSITKGSTTTSVKYSPSQDMYRRQDITSTQITLTLSSVERVTRPDGTLEIRRSLPDGLQDTQVWQNGVLTQRYHRYLLKDHLGSTDVILDQNGIVEQRQSFDSWDPRRNGNSWSALTASELLSYNHSRTNKSFTSHKMLDETGIIHISGRLYDAKLGRFLQADPLIQALGHTQSYNRYSYTFNGPLSFINPTGYSAKNNSDVQDPPMEVVVTCAAASS